MDEFNRIFDAVVTLGRITAWRQKLKDKQEQVNSVCALRCGNCDHWMKTSCVPEKQHKQFKSMNSRGCQLFVTDHSSAVLREQFLSERAAIESQDPRLLATVERANTGEHK